MFQFCCRDCCEDFKRLRGVVSQCEHCRQEKLLHEKLRFSGVEKSFCSEGKEMAKGPKALYLTAGENGRLWSGGLECDQWGQGLPLRVLYPIHPKAPGTALKRQGLTALEISASLDSSLPPPFQAACCCTNRTSLRSWGCAASLVPTAPRPASVESPSSWMAAPGTSAARTVRASTCCGTAR